jgi:hypothetical protein
MGKWRNDEVAEWQSGKGAEWQSGRVAEWQSESVNTTRLDLVIWQFGNLAI